MIVIDGGSVLQRQQNVDYAHECITSFSPAAEWYTLHMPRLDKLEGSSLVSERLYPGTRPGRRRACCTAYLRRKVMTYSVDSKESECFGFLYVLPCGTK